MIEKNKTNSKVEHSYVNVNGKNYMLNSNSRVKRSLKDFVKDFE